MYEDAWLDENEYPDDKDVEKFGYDSEEDYDPLTIGYISDARPSFWTTRRIVFLIIGLILVGALLLPFLSNLPS